MRRTLSYETKRGLSLWNGQPALAKYSLLIGASAGLGGIGLSAFFSYYQVTQRPDDRAPGSGMWIVPLILTGCCNLTGIAVGMMAIGIKTKRWAAATGVVVNAVSAAAIAFALSLL